MKMVWVVSLLTLASYGVAVQPGQHCQFAAAPGVATLEAVASLASSPPRFGR